MSKHQDTGSLVPGTVLEFFESRQILLGICLAVKNHRLSILTENNRELNLARSRILHWSRHPLDPQLSRGEMIRRLASIKATRLDLCKQVDTEELWSLLEGEAEGFSAQELAELMFSGEITDHHVAAIQRVLFQDRIHFQYKDGLFFARTAEKVKQRIEEARREVEREALLDKGSLWLRAVWQRKKGSSRGEDWDSTSEDQQALTRRIVESLKDFYLFGQEASDQTFTKELLKRAKLPPQPQTAFRILVRLGVWHEDENTYLYQQGLATQFPDKILELAKNYDQKLDRVLRQDVSRQDLRALNVITIDGALTRDYDDAISLKELDSGLYEVGVHIADVAAIVEPSDPVDRKAKERASSIYLPDQRIPMLPPNISDDLCSLRLEKDRPGLSFFFQVDDEGNIREYRISSSIIRVRQQLTYEEFNRRLEQEESFQVLFALSQKLRRKRLEQGATILPLPEVHIYVNAEGMIEIRRHLKETPSQIVVSELMITANAIAAGYMAEHNIPAIYRCQEECKPETSQVQSDYPLFHIYRQKRLFSRAELDTQPAPHCSLGTACYTSITSPIRRYIDLVSQRQLKHVLTTGRGLYSEEELRQMITEFNSRVSRINLVQRKWSRYWTLKYLEQEDIQALNALVLDKNVRFAHLLLPDFLMETNMSISEDTEIRPGEMIRIRIVKVNPREDILRVQIT